MCVIGLFGGKLRIQILRECARCEKVSFNGGSWVAPFYRPRVQPSVDYSTARRGGRREQCINANSIVPGSRNVAALSRARAMAASCKHELLRVWSWSLANTRSRTHLPSTKLRSALTATIYGGNVKSLLLLETVH